jgi:hypothetical protein
VPNDFQRVADHICHCGSASRSTASGSPETGSGGAAGAGAGAGGASLPPSAPSTSATAAAAPSVSDANAVAGALVVEGDAFLAVNSLLQFLPIIKDYVSCAEQMPAVAHEVRPTLVLRAVRPPVVRARHLVCGSLDNDVAKNPRCELARPAVLLPHMWVAHYGRIDLAPHVCTPSVLQHGGIEGLAAFSAVAS